MVARELLGRYHGIVQCDGYAAYEQFERMKGITLVGCWAHVRRKYVDALEENRTLATQAIHYIGKLYKVESDANDAGLTIEERKEKRISEAYPLIVEFEKWLQDAYLRVLPKSRMGKAIEYTYTLLPRLSRYVNDGRIATCKSAEVGPRIWMEAYSACKIFMLVKDRFTKMNASPSCTLRFISLVTMPLNE